MKLKCGTTRKDGKIFWAYDRSSKNGERWLTAEQFQQYKSKNNQSGRIFYCENKEKVKSKNRKADLKRRFGITIEKYNQMLKQQNNVCCICGKKCITKKRLCVDHCHNTNKVRGLLCRKCNSGLGHFKDNKDILVSALEYLKNYS